MIILYFVRRRWRVLIPVDLTTRKDKSLPADLSLAHSRYTCASSQAEHYHNRQSSRCIAHYIFSFTSAQLRLCQLALLVAGVPYSRAIRPRRRCARVDVLITGIIFLDSHTRHLAKRRLVERLPYASPSRSSCACDPADVGNFFEPNDRRGGRSTPRSWIFAS